MMFAQLTNRESLRDIEICLRGLGKKKYRIGLSGNVSRSTLADANETRSSQIYEQLCRLLIKRTTSLYAGEPFIHELAEIVYVLDSTYISLSLLLFPWARLGGSQGEIKIHTLLDLRGSIPSFIRITSTKCGDNHMMDNLSIEPGAFYIMDRAYVDFARLYRMHQQRAYFVVRPKVDILFRRQYSSPIEKDTGVRSDQVVKLFGRVASKKYHDQLRLIKYVDAATQKRLQFLTNNFTLPAIVICDLYKQRWQIEVFFKWIKQNLRIKTFYGNSQNAVETQIWIAICTYLLVAIAKKKLCIEAPLYKILQFLGVSLFEKTPLLHVFSNQSYTNNTLDHSNQLNLFQS